MDFGNIPSNIFMWAAIFTFILPLLTEFLNKPNISETTRGIAMFLFSVVFAFGNAALNGAVNKEDILSSFFIVFYGGIIQYQLWGKHVLAKALSSARVEDKATFNAKVARDDRSAVGRW